MGKPTFKIARTKHGEWVMRYGQEWRVEAPTFEDAAQEALHYALMYNSYDEVAATIERRRLTNAPASA